MILDISIIYVEIFVVSRKNFKGTTCWADTVRPDVVDRQHAVVSFTQALRMETLYLSYFGYEGLHRGVMK